jgi:hypothetical protein
MAAHQHSDHFSEEFGPDAYLVSSAVFFDGREFEVEVKHNGFSYWFDTSAKQRLLKDNPGFGAEAAIFNKDKLLENMRTEFTISAPVSDLYLKEFREVLSPAFWMDSVPHGTQERIDEILADIYFSQIKMQL